MTQKIGIHIFHRDLRLQDNLGLIELHKNVDIIIPIFILDKYQIIKSKHNKYYFSNNAVQFICESLVDLHNELIKHNSKLYIYFGNTSIIIELIIKTLNNYYDNNNIILSYNVDYSQYALKRDKMIDNIVSKYNIKIIKNYDDCTLISFDKMKKKDGNFGFKQFGAFYKNVVKQKINKPIKTIRINYIKKFPKIGYEYNIKYIDKFYINNENLAQNGGRIEALKKLRGIKKFNDYNKMRNRLDYATTNLSGYLNIGCISVRETYHVIIKKLGNKNDLIKQLYWRDFYLQAIRYIPECNKYEHIDKRYEKIKWKNSMELWKKIINSQTGFLLIDSAMNELRTTGYMHNRARLLVGSFWTKYLLINIFHPIYGSQVGFSKYLLDAIGPSQNKMNNQWITEFDYPGKKFSPKNAPIAGRPLNPSNKMISKLDPECLYIKKWLPHLSNVENNDLINWNVAIANKYKNIHPSPLFDYKEKYNEWIEICSKVK